jgi:nucleoside-diphosphate-sugar epimerase
MKAFVTGATGALGSRVVPLLVQAGHDVTAVARGAEKAEALRAAGAVPATVDLFDPAALVEAVAGHQAVLNLATHIPDLSKAARSKAWVENDRIRREGSRNLVDAALCAGASRFVQESVSFFYADGGDSWLAEAAALDVPDFAAAFLAAEEQAARFGAAGASGTVLRFGMFYGAGSSHTGLQLRLARRGISPFPGPRHAYLSFVHLDDAATAVVAALQAPAGVYNVTETEPATRRELAVAVGAALGRRPGIAIPGADRLGGGKTEYLHRSMRVSNRSFREAAGWTPAYPDPASGWTQVVDASNARALHETQRRPPA